MRLTRTRLALLAGLLVLVVLAVLVRPERVIPFVRSLVAHPAFPAILVGLYLLRPFVGWPIMVLSALVGFKYGVLLGLPLALAGVVLTSLIPYGAGRFFALDGPVLGRFSSGSRRYFETAGGLRGIVAARLAPLPAEPVSAAAGAGGVAVHSFVVGTLIGEIPWTVAAVTVGHSMNVFTVDGLEPDLRLVAFGLVAGLLLVAGPLYRAIENSR